MSRHGIVRLLAAPLFSLAAVVGIGTQAHATPLTLTGDYLKVGISDFGTFGSDGTASPGILHDPTGKQNFGVNDYLTPGNPHDGFAINSNQTGFIINDNHGGSPFGFTSPTVTTVAGYTLAATWTGVVAGQLSITNTYYFNPGDEQIKIKTTIQALTDLSNVSFGRSEDPDPDVNTNGDYNTVNTRGDSKTAAEDLVSAAGTTTGLTIGILNNSGNLYAHNTGISGDCCDNDNPSNVLNGYGPLFPDTNNGDFGLQMAWFVGDLSNGQTAEIDYSYVFGTNQGSVSVPGVPLPASAPMFGAALVGLAGLSFVAKRKKAAVAAA